jgi:hypothetical protein
MSRSSSIISAAYARAVNETISPNIERRNMQPARARLWAERISGEKRYSRSTIAFGESRLTSLMN